MLLNLNLCIIGEKNRHSIDNTIDISNELLPEKTLDLDKAFRYYLVGLQSDQAVLLDTSFFSKVAWLYLFFLLSIISWQALYPEMMSKVSTHIICDHNSLPTFSKTPSILLWYCFSWSLCFLRPRIALSCSVIRLFSFLLKIPPILIFWNEIHNEK